MADAAVCIGPPPPKDSYLNQSNLIAAALKTNCSAIHPGVGFLSENASFARLAREQGLCFIGPSSEVIELLGDKVRARETAQRFGLPITPGTKDAVADADDVEKIVTELGLPVIIKAAAGGGGKGMRIVHKISELTENLAVARREAEANFGDGRVFIERFIENPRHVELQLLSDGKTALVLGERDCSVQRNHQKLIEESPSSGVTDQMRGVMKEGAVKMFCDLGYCGAGTIEFLVEGDEFYFMEVNARMQVEHPVSEFTSNVDIVRQQILACVEGRMEIDEVSERGWAIECRINALSPGKIATLRVPGGLGVRFDSFLYETCTVPPYYDAMVGKLIVYAPNRPQAIAKMERALGELVIEGVKTNQAEQLRIIRNDVFCSGDFGVSFIERFENGNTALKS
jgi:acetyl-CoA carboxylase biotin carboxylase subunit